MLFNSFEFILLFLPIVFIFYFILNKFKLFMGSKAWLAAASLFFYGWWDVKYIPLILTSITVNYFIGFFLGSKNKGYKRVLLIVGILFNVCLLVYYKYFSFFVQNINDVLGTNYPIVSIVLPLGISFYTFTQIAYLVDSYRKESVEYNFLSYVLFVTYFPHLIAGPFLHHREMMPQFSKLRNKRINYKNVTLGLALFSMGLFKKVIIADQLAGWANIGFEQTNVLSFVEAWVTSLTYTFQLYFDFSGYSDMAIGISLLFNIKLPINFNSPYKSTSIQEFWRRWHITLGRFLTNYIYIPLGGNRKGEFRTLINLFTVFFISGIWHGAGWTFIIWGTLHGFAMIVNRLWKGLNRPLNKFVAWFITFNFINLTWVFFRADNLSEAKKVIKGMLGMDGFKFPEYIKDTVISLFVTNPPVGSMFLSSHDFYINTIFLLICFIVALVSKNSMELVGKLRFNIVSAIAIGGLLVMSILTFTRVSEFLYFNF